MSDRSDYCKVPGLEIIEPSPGLFVLRDRGLIRDGYSEKAFIDNVDKGELLFSLYKLIGDGIALENDDSVLHHFLRRMAANAELINGECEFEGEMNKIAQALRFFADRLSKPS